MTTLQETSTYELIEELKNRGYVTNLLYCVSDVKCIIEDINRDIEDKIEMSDDEMIELLEEWQIRNSAFVERLNDNLYTFVLNYNV